MINLTNMSCSVLIIKESQLQLAFTFKATQYTLTWLPLSYLKSLAIAHDLCQQDLRPLQCLPCTIWHYTDNILTGGPWRMQRVRP